MDTTHPRWHAQRPTPTCEHCRAAHPECVRLCDGCGQPRIDKQWWRSLYCVACRAGEARHRGVARRRLWAASMRNRHPGYVRLKRQQESDRMRAMMPNPRRGAWTAPEDAIVLRDDISTIEKMFMLSRSYTAVMNRRSALRGGWQKCGHCEADFVPSGARRQFFCSPQCRNKARAVIEMRTCPSCATDFKPKHSFGVYCSIACRRQGQRLDDEERKRRIKERNRAAYLRDREARLAYAKNRYWQGRAHEAHV